MKTSGLILLIGLTLIIFTDCFAQTEADEKEAIITVIEQAYIGGAYNDNDIKALDKGFHESFTAQLLIGSQYDVKTLQDWKKELDAWKSMRRNWNNGTTAEITVIDIMRDAAVARVNLNHNREHEYVEFLSLYKFNDGWKITNKISADIPPPYEQHLRSIEDWEQRTHRMQPLDKIMDAVGVKSGMVIGEIGAGRGRVTIPLANRVGDKGSVIANDIDKDALDFLSRRCRDRNIHNIETLLGEENDPLFPDNSLDMAILVWVFGAFEQPAEFFKNLKPSLKPGATFVLVQGNNESANAEAKLRGEEVDPNGPTLEERIEQAGIEAGYELVRIERFLERDIIVILRVKDGK